jgi:hypothetical protein
MSQYVFHEPPLTPCVSAYTPLVVYPACKQSMHLASVHPNAVVGDAVEDAVSSGGSGSSSASSSPSILTDDCGITCDERTACPRPSRHRLERYTPMRTPVGWRRGACAILPSSSSAGSAFKEPVARPGEQSEEPTERSTRTAGARTGGGWGAHLGRGQGRCPGGTAEPLPYTPRQSVAVVQVSDVDERIVGSRFCVCTR